MIVFIDRFTSHRDKNILRGAQHKPTPEWYHGYQAAGDSKRTFKVIDIYLRQEMQDVKGILKNCCQRGFLFLEQRKVDSLSEYLYIWDGFCLMVPVSSFAFVPRDKGWVGVFCLWVSMAIIITRPLHSATEHY